MADLPTLLLASLNPQTRKQAEQNLDALSIQPGFLSHILGLILTSTQDRAVRLSASVYLKNITKMRWDEDVQPLADQDKQALRNELVPAMLALSNPADKAIRAQVAESVSLIAELDFPEKWPNLIDQLVASLSQTNYNLNIGVLETAHSIFNRWRALVRSDKLYSEINYVLSKFVHTFLQIFKQTASLLLTRPNLNPAVTSPKENYVLLAQSMTLLADIFYDFTCHDLPPAIEDSYDEFFSPGTGLFHAFMSWDPLELKKDDPEDPTPSLTSQVKTKILEITELFIKLYPDQLQRSPAVESFVQGVWTLIGSNSLPYISDDSLVSQSLRFISTAIRSGYYKSLFTSKDVISSLIQGVVVPNVSLREHDVEQFEDDPLEFIRLDLAVSTTGLDLATRRQAAADVLQALVGSGYETETTDIVGNWIGTGLGEYQKSKNENWKAKDAAVYMLTAVATRGSTTQHGVTSTNALVDVVKFFSDHVFEDLQAPQGTVHPILQVDAIRFLHTFRNQLTKAQLLSVLPLLVGHLNSSNYVTYTYAAITIDRILLIKQNGQLLFGQADVRDFAVQLLNTLITKVLSAGTAEKVAENDHLMRCIMRVIITARQVLIPAYEGILQQLVAILGIISKNPSNPKFDQYIFEGLSALMRFVVKGNEATLPVFERVLFEPFTIILKTEIDQYIPYVFQILAQMLDLHSPTTVPEDYRSLLPFLLTPAVWQQKGSVPGLVKLLQAFLKRDAKEMLSNGQIASVLAVAQQRLIPSKVNDSWGFELLQAVVSNVSPEDLRQFYRPVIVNLLTRMQTSKTDKYVYLFARFVLFTGAIKEYEHQPDYTPSTIEEIQPQLWSQIFTNFVIPQVPKMPPKDRKLAVVGLTRLLTRSQIQRQEPAIRSWPAGFTALVKLSSEPQHLSSKSSGDDQNAGITEIDYEEQTAGYQAAYSRLAASELPEVDPVEYIRDVQAFVGQELSDLSKTVGAQQIKAMIGAAGAGNVQEQQLVGQFVQGLIAAGHQI